MSNGPNFWLVMFRVALPPFQREGWYFVLAYVCRYIELVFEERCRGEEQIHKNEAASQAEAVN